MSDFERRLRDAIDGQLWDYILAVVSFIVILYALCLWAFL